MKMIKDQHIYLLLVLLFIIQLLVISPRGEFPLYDDWVHSWSVYHYLSAGEFIYPGFLSANMHLPIFLGIILGKIFGFSFTLLRLANLVIALATVMIFYRFLRGLKVSLILSLFMSLLLWFNPIFFNLSYTYMGEILTLFFLIASAYFFYIGLEKKNYWLIFLGSLFSVLGFFVRQTAILLLPAVIIYFIFNYKKYSLKKVMASLGLPLAILSAYFLFFYAQWSPQGPAFHFPFTDLADFTFLVKLMGYLWLASLFILPASASFFIINGAACLKKFNLSKLSIIALASAILTIIALASAILTIAVFYYDFLFSYNILEIHVLGVITLISRSSLSAWGGLTLYMVLCLASMFNLIFIISIIFYNRSNFSIKNGQLFFLWAFIVFYSLLLLLLNPMDRYLLLLLPLFLIFGAMILQKNHWSKGVFGLLLLMFMLYSGAGTYNYLQWNKARWGLASGLLSQGISWQDIQAGYEWDGWQLYENSKLSSKMVDPNIWANPGFPQKKYVIAASSLSGYQLLSKTRVKGIFPSIKYLYLNQSLDK